MTEQQDKVLEKIVTEACVGLFRSFGVALRRKEQPAGRRFPDGFNIVGVVGIRGDKLSGDLVLATTFAVLEAARPNALRTKPLTEESSSDWLLVRDVMAELVNELGGMLKSRLLMFGVKLLVGMPTSLSGPMLLSAASKVAATKPIFFDAGGRDVAVWLCVKVDPATNFGSSREGAATGLEGGDVVFFLATAVRRACKSALCCTCGVDCARIGRGKPGNADNGDDRR